MTNDERQAGDTQVRRHMDGRLYVDVTAWEHMGFVEGAEVDVRPTMSPSTITMRSREPEHINPLIARAVRSL